MTGQKMTMLYEEQSKRWTVSNAAGLLLDYRFGVAEDPYPSFVAVRTPLGRDVALYRPWDHVWHTGMFFAWKTIDGFNFWESDYVEGPWGKAYSESFTPRASGNAPGFDESLVYRTEQGRELLRENRRITVRPYDTGYVIEADFRFRSAQGQAVRLERTPHTKEQPWGGYAGFSCRLQRTLMNPVITTDRGQFTADDTHGQPARWCDYSGRVDGARDEWIGIAMLDDRANPRHPSPMLTYDFKDLQFIQPAFLCQAPYELGPDETLRLRYAAYVHDGPAEAGALHGLWDRFVSERVD